MVKTSPADGAPEKSPGALVVPWQDPQPVIVYARPNVAEAVSLVSLSVPHSALVLAR